MFNLVVYIPEITQYDVLRTTNISLRGVLGMSVKLTKQELQEATNEDIFAALYWIAIKSTHEVNSKRGMSNITAKSEDLLFDEIVKRFNLDPNVLIAKHVLGKGL